MLMRRGFSLVEMIVAVLLACTIAAAAVDSLVTQQRSFAAAARAGAARNALHQGADVLSAELHAVSPRDGDIYLAQPDKIEFRMLLGASVLCTIALTRDAATLPPLRAASALGLTAWVAIPQRGDTVLAFDPAGPGPADDRWTRHVLSADPSSGASCPLASGFTASAAEAAAGWAISLAPPLSATVPVGSPIRFVRRARFELYRAADSRWYLGFLDCLPTRATPCAIVQPVAGPFDPGGVHLTFLDSLGAPSVPAGTALVTIDLHASAAGRTPGAPPWHDSLRSAVAFRD